MNRGKRNTLKKQRQAQQTIEEGTRNRKLAIAVSLISIFLVIAIVAGAAILTSSKPAKAVEPKVEASNTMVIDANTDFTRPEIILNKVKDLLATHPDRDCQADMTKWINSGQVKIEVKPDLQGDLGTSPKKNAATGEIIPTLLVPSDFLTATKTVNSRDIKLEKDMGLYHEYIHIRGHITGQQPLVHDIESLSVPNQARYYWDIEHTAFSSQWEYLKIHHGEHLMLKPSEVSEKGEKKAFLDYFYRNLKGYPFPNMTLYIPYWEKLYQAELSK